MLLIFVLASPTLILPDFLLLEPMIIVILQEVK